MRKTQHRCDVCWIHIFFWITQNSTQSFLHLGVITFPTSIRNKRLWSSWSWVQTQRQVKVFLGSNISFFPWILVYPLFRLKVCAWKCAAYQQYKILYFHLSSTFTSMSNIFMGAVWEFWKDTEGISRVQVEGGQTRPASWRIVQPQTSQCTGGICAFSKLRILLLKVMRWEGALHFTFQTYYKAKILHMQIICCTLLQTWFHFGWLFLERQWPVRNPFLVYSMAI